MTFEAWLSSHGYDAAALSETQRRHLEAAYRAEHKPAAKPASYAEIVAACAGIKAADDANFICDQLAKGATAEAAGQAWVETLQSRVGARDQELTALKAKEAEREKAEAERKATIAATAGTLRTIGTGLKPIAATQPASASETGTGSAREQIDAKVEALVAGGTKYHLAFAQVCRKHPELRAAMIEEQNAAYKPAAA